MQTYGEALEKDITGVSLRELQAAFKALADRYRDERQRKQILGGQGPFIASKAQRAAYLAYRFPATFAVAFHLLQKISPLFSPASLVDLGAGPGTLTLAALALFPPLQKATLVEQDREWIAHTKHLHAASPVKLDYRFEDFTKGDFPCAELIGSSYALSELAPDTQAEVVKRAWERAEKGVIFIEPGTPYGFSAILNARRTLIALGAPIAAPCPHPLACPLAEKGDWCHFSQRLERSKIHKLLKEADLGYEDEKYSYVMASKVPFEPYEARLVKSTEKHGGHIRLTLCTAKGLLTPTYSKRDGEIYKAYRKLDWGDCIKESNV